jgi:3-oxoacyl-[acyl-carrier-protein] synthase-3
LGIPEEKVFNTIQKYGNTTAATIPLGMDDAVKAGKLKPGMLVASAAFGSGFTWASAIFRW